MKNFVCLIILIHIPIKNMYNFVHIVKFFIEKVIFILMVCEVFQKYVHEDL